MSAYEIGNRVSEENRSSAHELTNGQFRDALPHDVLSDRNPPRHASLHYASVLTALPTGLAARVVKIEVSLHRGLPYFELVGVPPGQAQAVKSRVTAAIKNSGFKFPDQRIVASVTPDGNAGQVAGLDLPLAIALLQASDQVHKLDNLAFSAELSLLGECVHLPIVYNMFQALAAEGVKRIVGARANGVEAALVPASFILVANLRELSALLNDARSWQDLATTDLSHYVQSAVSLGDEPRLAELPGQFMAREALKIAAAGRHHMIMMGGAGCGKTSLAKILQELLPGLSTEERREVLAIYSAGAHPLSNKLLTGHPPFRSPHYEISKPALLGGGANLLPGELSLAHRGVLFLDELTEFPSGHLDSLRSALSDGSIELARNRARMRLPSDITLVAACNPCPCGNYLEGDGSCHCKPYRIQQKLVRLSGAFCDRIDLFVELRRIPKEEILRTIQEGQLCDLEAMKTDVKTAIDIQSERYQALDTKRTRNSNLEPTLIKQYFLIETQALRLAEKIAQSNQLSIRAFHKLLRVGRTIADLEQSDTMRSGHVSLAAQYRHRSYFSTQAKGDS